MIIGDNQELTINALLGWDEHKTNVMVREYDGIKDIFYERFDSDVHYYAWWYPATCGNSPAGKYMQQGENKITWT